MSERELAALRAHRIGFVFQSFHLLDGLTALDNVAQGLLYAGAHRTERQQRAREMLRRVGLENRAAHPPKMLAAGSGSGWRSPARCSTGRRSCSPTSPPATSTPHSGEEVLGLLHELNEDDGTTIVVITHEHDVANAMRRRVEIRDGLVTHDTRRPTDVAGVTA